MPPNYLRLGEFDYLDFGIKERWKLYDAANMLVSYYMETRGLFDSDDAKQVFSKLSQTYSDYLWNILSSQGNYEAAKDEYDEEYGTVSLERVQFNKKDMLAFLEAHDDLKLDIAQLKRFLTCEEKPAIQISSKIISDTKVEKATVVAEKDVTPPVNEVDQSQDEDKSVTTDKMSLMWKCAFDIAAFCKVNADDDYIPIFEDVVHHLELKYGKEHVPDSWIKEILEYAPISMAKKDGRPRKILPDAIKAGFCMREWYDDDKKITEPHFKEKFKKYLPKVSANVRTKAWDCLDKIKKEGTQGADK